MATYDLGKVVGDAGEKGDDGSTVWNTSTAPTYANSKYTFNISNLSGKTGLEIAVNDIIFYSTYYYIVSAVNSTTVDCSTRVSIKGSDASVTIVSSWNSTTSDSKVPSEKLTKDSLDAKADTGHTHTISNVTNLQTTLDGKASSTHTHTISDVTNLQTTLDGKASSSHNHSISDVTNLQTNLNNKVNTSDIANNLTTTTAGKVLDARQGKALADLIGDAITYINQ